jgi:hypothetical protein
MPSNYGDGMRIGYGLLAGQTKNVSSNLCLIQILFYPLVMQYTF